MYRRSIWEGAPKRVRAPYLKYIYARLDWFLSRVGHVKSGLNLGGPPSKSK